MAEQTESTPHKVANEEIKKRKSPSQIFNLNDIFTNTLVIGDIHITSPIMPVSEMVKTTKELLKDKQIRTYLEILKENRIKIQRSMFG